MKTRTSFVCLGGGVGTVNLIKGLKSYTDAISVVISMADDGGSAGRLRRLYNILPPGDLVSCMAALTSDTKNRLDSLLTYRFRGNRYGSDNELSGQKLGNLIMVALRDITGDFTQAISLFQSIFHVPGKFYPATSESVSISAQTVEGKMVHGEENIDLGKYNGKRVLQKLFLEPKDAKAPKEVIDAMDTTSCLVAGPGDLYTTILPVLLVPDIKASLLSSKARKILVINVANKPFETKGYSVNDYIASVTNHLGTFPFDVVIANNNTSISIPKKFKYDYVMNSKANVATLDGVKLVQMDLIDEKFPIYHSSKKLARAVWENI